MNVKNLTVGGQRGAMDEIRDLGATTGIPALAISSFILVAGGIGTVAVAISTVCIPFVAPALRYENIKGKRV